MQEDSFINNSSCFPETPNCSTAFMQGQSHRQISEWSSVGNDVGPLPLLYAILIITSCIFILQVRELFWHVWCAGALNRLLY